MSQGNPRVAGVLIVLLLAAGCGQAPTRPQVQGRVTYKEKPVPDMTLVLVSAGKPGERFMQKIPIRADGTFVGEVPSPGTYTVVIEESLARQEHRKPGEKDREDFPRKYRDAATSDETWGLHEGENQREIKLRD